MVKVEFLFPELSYVFAESYNMEYLSRCSDQIQVIRTSHKEIPRFVSEQVDMIYMGCTTERGQELEIKLLEPYRDRIKELIDGGTVFLITGNALEIFGQYIKEDERTIPALGLFEYHSQRYLHRRRYDKQFSADFNGMNVIGHKSLYSFSYGEFNHPFMTVERGDGMNEKVKEEGVHMNNFFATYSLGPFLILNPNFTAYLLKLLGLKDKPLYMEQALAAYESRLASLLKTVK